MRRFAIVLCCVVISSSVPAESPPSGKPLLRDDFTTATHAKRSATRGDWKIAGGVISVEQDPELYQKFANHGPLLAYAIPHGDAVARVDFRPSGCKSVVFTMDAEGGHAFRIILPSGRPGVAYGYDPQPGEDRPKANALTRELPALVDKTWTSLQVHVDGEDALIKIDEQTFQVSHPSIGQEKTVVKIGFAFGSFEVRKFELDEH